MYWCFSISFIYNTCLLFEQREIISVYHAHINRVKNSPSLVDPTICELPSTIKNVTITNVTNMQRSIFMSVFALLLLLIEFPDTFPILQMAPSTSNNSSFRNSPPPLTLYNWIPRGIFYIFLSVVCFQQEIVVRALDMDEHLSTSSRFFDSIPIVLAAWFMLGTGIMYVLLGMCCLQKVMERVRREEKECWDEYYEHLRLLDLEESEVEEREWMLENEEGDRSGCCYCGCCRIWGEPCRRWYRRYRRRRQRGEGFCSVLGCRSLDWRC